MLLYDLSSGPDKCLEDPLNLYNDFTFNNWRSERSE